MTWMMAHGNFHYYQEYYCVTETNRPGVLTTLDTNGCNPYEQRKAQRDKVTFLFDAISLLVGLFVTLTLTSSASRSRKWTNWVLCNLLLRAMKKKVQREEKRKRICVHTCSKFSSVFVLCNSPSKVPCTHKWIPKIQSFFYSDKIPSRVRRVCPHFEAMAGIIYFVEDGFCRCSKMKVHPMKGCSGPDRKQRQRTSVGKHWLLQSTSAVVCCY